MQIKQMAFGVYQTNCYIIDNKNEQIVIDPGVGAVDWVKKNTKNLKAILCTHGHFDHAWSVCELKKIFQTLVYMPSEDSFMLERDIYSQGQPTCKSDVLIDGDNEFSVGSFTFRYILFPGHTPGCSIIEIGDYWFSGDFIFENSIGRVDLPYSNPKNMKKSLEKFMAIKYDKIVYPGHGQSTTIENEQKNCGYWLSVL